MYKRFSVEVIHEQKRPHTVAFSRRSKVLSEELGGTIKDQTRSVMTTQTIEYCRQEIRDFQFRHSV
jgi:hypothetical protein